MDSALSNDTKSWFLSGPSATLNLAALTRHPIAGAKSPLHQFFGLRVSAKVDTRGRPYLDLRAVVLSRYAAGRPGVFAAGEQ